MSVPSLLAFLDAPLLVGDQEGRAAYLNPAFTRHFGPAPAEGSGTPMASLFEGGAREAVLRAVAQVANKNETVRFRLRHGGMGYVGLACPIEAEESQVGCILLFVESDLDEERVGGLQRELLEPLADLRGTLEEIAGAGAGAAVGALAHSALRQVSRMIQWGSGLADVAARGSSAGLSVAGFDAARAVGSAAGRVAEDYARQGVTLEVQVPAVLPRVRGDARTLENALVDLLRARLEHCSDLSTVSVAAERGEGEPSTVVIRVVDSHGGGDLLAPSAEPEPETVIARVREIGGRVHTHTSDDARRTDLRLPALKQ